MRIQSLAVIFVIIVLPISLVLQAYMRNITNVTNLEAKYDNVLMGATYDAVRAYQLNTINNDYSSVNSSRQRDVKASVNSFFNSLSTGLNIAGSTRATMNEYVPSLLFTLYDGFYIYGPYNNIAEVENGTLTYNTDITNSDNEEFGLKPFTYYSCEYADVGYDVTIDYSLDNYIAVSGNFNGTQISGAGYYINPKIVNVPKTVEAYINGNPATVYGMSLYAETLGEYVSFYDKYKAERQAAAGSLRTATIEVADKNGAISVRYYYYINYNNVKYYFDPSPNQKNSSYIVGETPPIFTVSNHLREYISQDELITLATYQGWKYGNEAVTNTNVRDFVARLDENWARQKFKDVNSYYYYKKAKTFSEEIGPYLAQIKVSSSTIKNANFNTDYVVNTSNGNSQTEMKSYSVSGKYAGDGLGYIFNTSSTSDEYNPELEVSRFNQHRIDVICKTVESALVKTIASLNDYYGNTGFVYEMPAITMSDWDMVANQVTVISFMQGLSMGNYKYYNNYSVVANTTNKEFVSKDSIYVQQKYAEQNMSNGSIMNDGGATVNGNSGFNTNSYSNIPSFYRNAGNGVDMTYHSPRCGNLTTSVFDLIGYRKMDYLVESYQHDYTVYTEMDENGFIPYSSNTSSTGVNMHYKNSTMSQVIDYYMQPGGSAYECVVSHNGYEYTFDQLLTNNVGNSKVATAYVQCLAREKNALYKNLDTMNYHRIYMYQGGKLLGIAVRTSGEEIGELVLQTIDNSGWTANGTTLNRDYTMPYRDVEASTN